MIQTSIRERRLKYVSNNPVQTTLRELKRTMKLPVTVPALTVVAVILGLSGPFDTYAQLPVAGRMAYWLVVVFATYVSGRFGAGLTHRLISNRLPKWPRLILVGVGAGVPVAVFVVIAGFVVFGVDQRVVPRALDLSVYCVLISIGIVVGFEIVGGRLQAQSAPAAPATSPPLLRRLDVTKRGTLISLSVQDHYVEVTTSKGKALILMRLGDAMAETAGVPGVQIHRSYWVALDAVRSVKRQSGRVLVETNAGDVLRVSRSFLDAAKQAGLIA